MMSPRLKYCTITYIYLETADAERWLPQLGCLWCFQIHFAFFTIQLSPPTKAVQPKKMTSAR